MISQPPTLFEFVVVQRYKKAYAVRVFLLLLAVAFYGVQSLRYPDVLPMALIFTIWTVESLVFWYLGTGTGTTFLAFFLLQTLSDQVFLLLLVHLSGGISSPYLLVFEVWTPLMVALLPSKVAFYLGAFGGVVLVFLLESYRLSWLQPLGSLAFAPTQFFWHYEIIAVLIFGLAIVLINSWLRSYEHNWQRTFVQGAFLQSLANIAAHVPDLAQNEEDFDLLAQRLCDVADVRAVAIASWNDSRHSAQWLGMAGDKAVLESVQPTKMLGLLQRKRSGFFSLRGEYVWLTLPLRQINGERILGGVMMAYPQVPTGERLRQARKLTNLVALILGRVWQYQELEKHAVLLHRLSDEIVHLTANLQQNQLLPAVAQATGELLDSQRFAIYIAAPDGALDCEFSRGLSPEYVRWVLQNHRFLPEWQQVSRDGYVAVADVYQDQRTSPQVYYLHREKIQSYVLLNLRAKDRQVGVLALYWGQPRTFSAQELEIARLFAQRAAEVIINADHFDQALQEALTDGLTGLPNRRALDRRLQEETRRSQRYQHSFAYLMIDLDGFKRVNDEYGHPIGDSVLKQVSIELRQIMRETDFLSRYGGDEFAVILPEADREDALAVADKIRHTLEKYLLLLPNDERRQMLSACVGIAVYPEDADVPDELIRVADQRLYRAKRHGRGTLIALDW